MFHLRIAITALQGLKQNLLRTLLATLGVVIGVGAVVAAVSILEGSQRTILDQVEAFGADQLIVINGSEERHHRRTPILSLIPDDARKIRAGNPELIVATAPQYNGSGQIKYYAKNANVQVLGTSSEYAEINSYEVAKGRFINQRAVQGRSMVCVLGHGVKQELFGELPAVGESVKINGKGFKVIGVMEARGALGFSNVDDQVIVPITTAMARMFGQKNLTMLVAQCVEAARLQECIEGTKRSLRAAHRIKAGAADDFIIFTQDRMKQQIGQFAKIFAIVLYSIAGISIVVGAIGIMNIMLVSVTERTREIGVRMAVGARRFDILKQFLIESSIISILGGVFGGLCGWAIANFLSEFTGVLEVHTRPTLVVIALGMALVVGIISGIYPAVRASRLDPVTALRYE